MVEVAMPMIGPGGIGPGVSSGGGCDFRSCLSVNVLDRMGKEQGVKAQAVDLATGKSELHDRNAIDIYRLLVGQATFRDKVSGNIVTEKTLISPDFNDESIGVWTDAGEHGTGSKEEYQAILYRARKLANTPRAATMFWISPSNNARIDSLPEHRAYLWKKNEDGEVTAYSYQFSGARDTLTKTLINLSQDSTLVDTQTLLWEGGQDTVSHQKVYDAYRSSLTSKEADSTSQFLERFRQEAERPDSARWKRIESYKKQYEEKLRKVYTNDIQSAVEAVASGFLAIARNKTSGNVREAVSKKAAEEYARKDVSPQLSSDISRLSPESREFPARIDAKNIRDDRVKKQEKPRTQKHTIEESKIVVQEIIQPMVPAWVHAIGQIAEGWRMSDVSSHSETRDSDSVEVIDPFVPAVLRVVQVLVDGSVEYDVSDIAESGEYIPPIVFPIDTSNGEFLEEALQEWMEIVSTILGEDTEEHQDVLVNQKKDSGHDGGNEVSSASEVITLYTEVIHLFLPQESPDAVKGENQKEDTAIMTVDIVEEMRKRVVVEILDILELLVIDSDTPIETVFGREGDGVDGEKVLELEEKVVSLGENILTILSKTSRERNSFDEETVAMLSVFLDLYRSNTTSETVKRFVASLIYLEIKGLGKQKILRHPQVTSVLKEFETIGAIAPIFETRLTVFLERLSSALPIEGAQFFQYISIHREKLARAIFLLLLSMVYSKRRKMSNGLLRNQLLPEQFFSFERLLKSANMLNRQKPQWKATRRNKSLPKLGLIYLYAPTRMVYLSKPLVREEQHVTQ